MRQSPNQATGQATGLATRLGSCALRYRWPQGSLNAFSATTRAPSLPQELSKGGNEEAAVAENSAGDHDAESPDAESMARLEAILFLAREPLSTRKLAELAGLSDGTFTRTLVRRLNQRLRGRGSALEIVEVAGGMRLMTRPTIADWLVRLHGLTEDVRLSPVAMETLAVVAYRQPVLRAEIEAIRGVQCGEMLRVLMERDFLRIVGRSEELGRPFLYGTTRNFLQVFGLRRLEQLPPIDQTLSAAPPVAETEPSEEKRRAA